MVNFLILHIALLSLLQSSDRGWTHPETGWQSLTGTNMCIFIFNDVYVNNEPAEDNQSDAIGIFYQDECVGWGYYQPPVTIILTIGDDGDNPGYPDSGDQVDFYIYDQSDDQILELQSTIPIPSWESWLSNTIQSTYACQLNLPIQSDGTCPDSCDADFNGDTIINIIDVIAILDTILFCEDCEDNSCGDMNGDNEINIQDILILVDLIVDY